MTAGVDASDRTALALGIELTAVGDGRATARLRLTDDMVNVHGIGHGGYLFLLADVAFSYACNSRGRAVAHAAEVAFLRPVRPAEVVTAVAVERTRSGRDGLYDVTLRNERGTVVAEFRGHARWLGDAPAAEVPE
ncbi:hydroxyphenylacetyl-CoA thioesterase PaaI [Actinokineospora inagensis]|uniref:hydroxyphenylacetyl-CoA thioesterase PaaI n=1 Tax=Actinokineospora inagensis TaxID=103730 RepID=UPI000416EF53|nr:hydroxyphenylacetyl-CoA thioesterase PaaI [Actinokineospora inagensis]